MESSLEKILIKFIEKSASSSELEQLLQWISSEHNYKIFIEYAQINNISNIAVNQPDKDKIIKEIEFRINKQKSSKSLTPSKIIDYSIYSLTFISRYPFLASPKAKKKGVPYTCCQDKAQS